MMVSEMYDYEGKQTMPRVIMGEIIEDMYVSFWKRKRESTTMSPSGPHIGHYKIALDDEGILNVHRLLLVLPFHHAFAPKKWCKSMQLVLQKDEGELWTRRLRIIELLDANVNAGLMIVVGRNLIHHANDRKLIYNSEYGSVPRRTAQDALLHKVLTIDTMRRPKQAGTIFECDATRCYDQDSQELFA